MIQLTPKWSVSEVVRILKGGSSYIIQKDLPELEEFVWGKEFWTEGYFAESAGQVSEKRLKEYIKNQRSSMTRKG